MKPGELIGDYKVERRLGRGAMGSVYLVTQVTTGRRCALKVLNGDDMEDGKGEALTRFKHEVQSLVQLRGHPSIVGVLDSGVTAEQDPYFVMEFVEGVTFRQALRGGAPLPELLEALEQVARALAHAHQLGFVHRDVKPENVLLGADGVSRLTDFGIAASLYRTKNLTQTGSILGTLAYMAPEQANPQLGRVGPWSDAFSLGAMLYEVLTGRPPLSGQNTMELLTKLLLLQSGEIQPPRALAPAIDPRLEAVCLRALAWKPGERYRSLAELADGLARARPPVTGKRWVALHAAITAGTSVSDEDGLTAGSAPTELAAVPRHPARGIGAAGPLPAGPLPAGPLPADSTERTTVDTSRRGKSGQLVDRLEATVAEEDHGTGPAASSGDLPPAEAEGGSRALLLVTGVAIASVLLVGAGLAVVYVRQQTQPQPIPTGPVAFDTGPLRALLLDGKWEEAIREGQRLGADHAHEPELQRLVADAHQGRVLGAFRADDTARARQLLPAGWERPFPELPWILALSGDPAAALAALPEDAPAEHRARLAAWAGDEEACRAALEKCSLDRGRALAWELAAYLPPLRPTPTSKSLLPADDRAEGWGAAARGEEALARGVVAVAAIAFDDAQRGEPDEAVRLQAALGLTRVELARGRLTQAAEQLSEAFRWVRHPLDQARCLGWSALLAVAAGADPEPLKAPTGGDVLARARRYAPGAPEVQSAAWTKELLGGWSREAPAALEGASSSCAWAALETARQARRQGTGALTPGQLSFVAFEREACERGEDGAVGLLAGRAMRLASQAEQSGWRVGAQEAQRLLEPALRLRPASPALQLAQARVALLLRQHEQAREAVERAGLLSPRDPEVLLVRARVLRAALERSALELDQAELRGEAPAEAATRLAEGLLEVLGAFRAARDAAQPEGAEPPSPNAAAEPPSPSAAAHPLARAARVGAAWTLLERMRRLTQAGQPGVPATLAELKGELEPLLAGPQGGLAAPLLTARAKLADAVRGGEPLAVETAEQALRAAADPLDHAARQALLIAGLAGDGACGQAWLAVAGDLPARALLALRQAEAASDPAHQETWLARGQALAPELPQLTVAGEVQRGLGKDAGSFLRLARALPRSSHLLSLFMGLLYFAERPPQEELLAGLDAAREEPGWVPPLARALALRTFPIYRFPEGEPSASRLKELALDHDRLSSRGVVEATLALQQGAPGALPHLLRAMCQSSLGLGSPRGSRCDPRVLPDVRHDIACARAAAPHDPSVALYWLHWSQDRLPETVDELLAMGFLANRDALLRHYQRDKVDEVMRELNDLVPRDNTGPEVRRGVERLQKGERPLLLVLGLATLAADRLETGSDEEELPPPGRAALGAYPQETWAAQARTALALARSGRPELLDQAGDCALRALDEASPAGDALLPAPEALLAAGALPRLPSDYPHRAELVPNTIPMLPSLGDATLRLRRPEEALDTLTRAWAAQHPEPLPADASPCAPGQRGFPRGRSLLLAPQEALAQDRLVGWLVEGERLDEALLCGLRAGAFSRVEAPAAVLHRVARERVRPHALAREGQPRTAALQLALVLAREARAVSRFPAGHGALIALLEVDLAALGAAEERGPRVAWARSQAEEAFETKEREVDPWLAAWALVRACVAGEEPVPPAALDRLRDPSLRAALRRQLQHDPLAAQLRAQPELAPLLPE